MNPNEFMGNLQELQSSDPVKFEQMMILLKAIGSPPESLVALFDRLEIPWDRKQIDGVNCIVIQWKEFMAGEKRNQEQGPILKRIAEESAANSQSRTESTGPLEVPDDRNE